MALQQKRLVHKFPEQKKLICLLYNFCHQSDMEFRFSREEFVELCDWLVHQDEGAESFWEEFSDALGVGDLAVHSLLRKIIPKTKGSSLIFTKIPGGGFIPAIRRFLLLFS